MTALQISALGPLRVSGGKKILSGFESNKVRALFVYLVVEMSRPHSRESLADMFWSESSTQSALANLRYALADLRRVIGDEKANPPYLLVSRESLQFNAKSNYELDIAEFKELINTNDVEKLRQAVALYQGDFLEGSSSIESDSFEEWVVLKREQFKQQAIEALQTITNHHEGRGEYQQALHFARQQIELEPWLEEAHQQLMRLLALDGQRSAALAQYERCRRLLMQELDVEPLPETTQLFEEIRDGKLTRAGGEKGFVKINPSNLPHPLTSFIGRGREVAEVERLITDTPTTGSNTPVRLLTLLGAGGCGKTRLSIESARRLATSNRFPNGIWWIDLARLNDPALVTQAVTAVLGLREAPDIPLITLLTNFLRNKEMLLLLDNCEHLIDACAQITETLLLACPKLQILATSREVLDIDGERTFQVDPLSLPDPANLPPLEKFLDYEAVHLFVDRAEAALPDFALTPENAPAVIQICRRLDGIPLAIELAARQLKTLPIKRVAAQLEDRFLMLTNGRRTALPHHHTLRAAIDWSYDFLSEEERSLFRQLSIFSGGWTLESASQITTDNTLELLNALVNKSLIVVEQTGRYRMLETIRQYGREKLIEAGQEESVQSRHLDFFLQFAERSRNELRGGDQRLWMDQVQADHDNIRSALEWSLRSAKRSEAGLRLAVAISEFWNRCNYYLEERRWLERALGLIDETCPTRLRAWGNLKMAYCAFCLGDFATMQACLDGAWKIFSGSDNIEGIALVMRGRAALVGEQKYDLETTRVYLEESVRLLRSLDNKWELAETLRNLGYVFYLQRDSESARTCLNEALLLCRETSNTVELGQTLYHLGRVACQEGDYPSARSYFEESQQIAKEDGDRGSDMDVLNALGELARTEQDYQQAQVFYEEGLPLARELGAEYATAAFLQGLGYVSLHCGDYQRATELLNEGLQYWQKHNMRQRMAGNLAGLAGVAAALGEMEKAAQLLGKVDALMKERGSYLLTPNQSVYEHSLSAARASLGEEQFRAAWETGYDLISSEANPSA